MQQMNSGINQRKFTRVPLCPRTLKSYMEDGVIPRLCIYNQYDEGDNITEFNKEINLVFYKNCILYNFYVHTIVNNTIIFYILIDHLFFICEISY